MIIGGTTATTATCINVTWVLHYFLVVNIGASPLVLLLLLNNDTIVEGPRAYDCVCIASSSQEQDDKEGEDFQFVFEMPQLLRVPVKVRRQQLCFSLRLPCR